MINKDNVNLVSKYLDELFPNAKCELYYTKDYELLLAVMLSAQATDKSVNEATIPLFKEYDSLEKLSKLSIKEIEYKIRNIGLFENKAKYMYQIIRILLNQYNGVVPKEKEVLTTFPGVGNKTANVVRIELFNIPEFPVDTHVNRLAKRFGFATQDDSLIKVENKLKNIFPEEEWIKRHHQLVLFGRYYCKAINPMCKNCKLIGICRENH